MSKLMVKLPETKEKKPLLLNGNGADVCGFYTDGNYNKIKLSPNSILRIAKNTHKRLGVENYITYIEIIDHMDHYTYRAC